ncbi:MAG: hypothetical protein WBB07_01140 [Mycobacterium sp.]
MTARQGTGTTETMLNTASTRRMTRRSVRSARGVDGDEYQVHDDAR